MITIRTCSRQIRDYEYADKVACVLEENGVRVLRNEYEEIMIDGRSVTIVGVDDGLGRNGSTTACADDSFTIYLIHEPGYRWQLGCRSDVSRAAPMGDR